MALDYCCLGLARVVERAWDGTATADCCSRCLLLMALWMPMAPKSKTTNSGLRMSQKEQSKEVEVAAPPVEWQKTDAEKDLGRVVLQILSD